MPAPSVNVDDKRVRKRKSDTSHQDSKKHQSKKQKVVVAALIPDASGSVRLHITPLTRETASTIVPKTDISKISFHNVATFPEKSYAYVDLPIEDAERVMKKYNGTVFRGVKMSVEEARKSKERKDEQDEEVALDKMEKKTKKRDKKDRSKEDLEESKEKKKKRMKKDEDHSVLSGVELPEGRQVQRGWTKDTKSTSKNQAKPECMFKVIIPPVVATRNSSSPSLSPTVSKIPDKKKKNKKVKGAQKNQVVVKEFENSTKFPQFLKMNNEAPSQKPAVEYIEGSGWVDEDGAVVDDRGVEKRRKQAERLDSSEREDKQSESGGVETGSDSTFDDTSSNSDANLSGDEESQSKSNTTSDQSEEASNSTTSSELYLEAADSPPSVTIPEITTQVMNPEITITSKIQEDTSEQESFSGEEQKDGNEVEVERNTKDNEDDDTPKDSLDTSSSDLEGESVDEQVSSQEKAIVDVKLPEAKPATKGKSNIDGLSAMFKPSVSAQVESSSVFKFFPDEDEDEDEEMDDIVPEPATPLTPYDKRRRSAAPTPDTAVASRFPRHVIPLSPTQEIGAKYFAPQQEILSNFGLGLNTGAEYKLLFPHTGSSFLHGLSLWSSLPMPKILTTGEVIERKGSGKEKQKGEEEEAVAAAVAEKNEAEVEQIEPIKPEDYTMEDHHNLRMNKLQRVSQKFDDQSIGRARTGAGSGIQGWAGKKKTFDDDEDNNNNDNRRTLNFAPPIHAEGITKSRTGAGSGIVGWAGKKKTFDDDNEDTFYKPTETQEDVATSKPKTGSGSGVVGWAGKKKTFDDIDEEEEVSNTVTAEPLPQAVVKKPLLKVKTWDNEAKDQQAAKDLTRAEIWKEVFYKKRGEWNREWKRRRREVAKAKRKRENSRRKV